MTAKNFLSLHKIYTGTKGTKTYYDAEEIAKFLNLSEEEMYEILGVTNAEVMFRNFYSKDGSVFLMMRVLTDFYGVEQLLKYQDDFRGKEVSF